jgi:3-oxoacyl-[acyl-carrier-protein] synthase II
MNLCSKKSIAITGMGIGSPAGYTLEDNFAACWEGKECFSPITRYETVGSSVKFAGDCPTPDTRLLPDRKVQKILRRKDVISLITTLEAARSANLFPHQSDPERCGMYVGASSTQVGDLTPYFMLVEGCADLRAGTFDSARFGQELMSLVNPLVVLQNLMNNGLCFGSMTLDFRGVNANFMDFQIAGLRALGEGFRSICQNRADIVIAGGVAGTVEPFQLAEGVKKGYLAPTNDIGINPSQVIQPWGEHRCGTILSEGSSYLVLENETHAMNRGAAIHGHVIGFGMASDGQFSFMDADESPGLLRAMELACKDAELTAHDLIAVIGHGNGATQGDFLEISAYEKFFSKRESCIPLASVKSVVGDMCEAAGALATCVALEAIRRRELPPTFNIDPQGPVSNKLSISSRLQKLQPGPVMITARSFLGISAALIVSPP